MTYDELVEKGGEDVSVPTFQSGGISLRDYFAAKAMQAIRSGPEWQLLEMKSIAADNGTGLDATIAHYAYRQADAMLATSPLGEKKG